MYFLYNINHQRMKSKRHLYIQQVFGRDQIQNLYINKRLLQHAGDELHITRTIYNTPCYGSSNYFLITFIRGLMIHQVLRLMKF
jgi:hypothetical protein